MKTKSLASKLLLPAAFLTLGMIGVFLGMKIPGVISEIEAQKLARTNEEQKERVKEIAASVVPGEGFTLPIKWGDFGPKMIKAGVIDETKFLETVRATEEQTQILRYGSDKNITINSENSQFVVDFLWALGLAQKSLAYEEGPLVQEDPGLFASTGGWNLAKGDAVNYLNKFDWIPLTSEQHLRVKEIAQNVYRPCCDNDTWFPDCNHGMAALAAIEMMVSANMTDEEIYKNILKLNSFWFPDSYIKIAVYFDRKGTAWDKINAKEVLGREYSSATGAMETSRKVGPLPDETVSAGSCGA
jgi:hypothetical protein